MQTFITYCDPDPHVAFYKTATLLDYRRLGKQRVEAYQILRALRGESTGWVNHPCTKMWRDYEHTLTMYHDTMVSEWIKRGFKNTMKFQWDSKPVTRPVWLTDEFVLAHRSNLVRKMPEHYSYAWPDVSDNLPYIWPVQ